MLILDLWGISFYAVVVLGLGKDLLYKSVLGHYERLQTLGSFYNYCRLQPAAGFRPVYEIFMQRANYIPHVRALVRSAVQSPAAHRTTQLE